MTLYKSVLDIPSHDARHSLICLFGAFGPKVRTRKEE